MMVTKVRRLPLVVSGVQGGIWFTDCVADWVRNRRTVIAASCPGVFLSMKICARRKVGRRKRARRRFNFLLAMVPCATSLVTRCKYMSQETKAFLAMGPFHCRLAGWLPDQLFDVLSSDWLSDWLIYRSTWKLTNLLTDWLTDWPTD